MTAEEFSDLSKRLTIQYTTTGLLLNNIEFHELQSVFDAAAGVFGCSSPGPCDCSWCQRTKTPSPDPWATQNAVVVSGIDERGQRVGWEVDPRFLNREQPPTP